MKQITKEYQGIEYTFDFCTKDKAKRDTPTVVVLLKKTDNKNIFESFCVDVYQKPISEFTLNPILPEVQRADYVLLLRYKNHSDPEKDQQILKALGHILMSNFLWDKEITLNNVQP